MKKVFTCAIVLLVFAIFNKADAQKGFSVSIKGGSQLNYLHNTDDNDKSNFKSKTFIGGNIGVGVGYNFTERVGIATDVSYSIQGRRYEMNGVEFRQKMNYVKVPVMFSYNSDPYKKISFSGKIGPQVSFLAQSKLADDDGHIIIEDTKDNFNSVTFGAVTNIGMQYKIGPRLYMTSGLRIDYDFTNAEDDIVAGYPAGRASSHNSTIGFQSGLKYVF